MAPVTELTMAINATFSSILHENQVSNLNFSIQVTPFAAYITLKKSVQKDLDGLHATPSPPIIVHLQQAQQEILHLQKENFQLKSVVATLEEKCETITIENDRLVGKHEDIKKNVESLIATKNILDEKINGAEREAASRQNENSVLLNKIKDGKKKHEEELKELKSKISTLDKANKRKEKELHNLGRILENTRATNKACKVEKSQLLINKSKLEAELRKLKKIQTTKSKEVFENKSNTADENANYSTNPCISWKQLDLSVSPSLVSHWNPHCTRSQQRPESIISMVTHCISSRKDDFEDITEEKMISKEAFEELIAEFRAQLKADRAKILAEVKSSFRWLKEP